MVVIHQLKCLTVCHLTAIVSPKILALEQIRVNWLMKRRGIIGSMLQYKTRVSLIEYYTQVKTDICSALTKSIRLGIPSFVACSFCKLLIVTACSRLSVSGDRERNNDDDERGLMASPLSLPDPAHPPFFLYQTPLVARHPSRFRSLS